MFYKTWKGSMQASILKTTLIIAFTDLLMLVLIMALCLILRNFFGGYIRLEVYGVLFISLLLIIPIYTAFGLYPPILVSAADAVRRLSLGTTTLFLIIFTMTFFFRSAENYSRLALLIAWVLALLVMPVWRGILKRCFSRFSWWGNDLILCGGREWILKMVPHLFYNSAVGLKPCGVVLLDDTSDELSNSKGELSVEVFGYKKITLPLLELESLPDYAHTFNSPYAIINLHNLSNADNIQMARFACHFKKTFFVLPFFSYLTCWSSITDLGGAFALETRQKLLDVRRQYIKRAIDLFLTLCGTFIFIPATIVIALLIKLEDGGPVFFAHTRVGKDGKQIKILKFRTMVTDAEAVLQRELSANSELDEEWKENHKLKNDPRITKIGKWLRKTSLDELPQVWNVLKGELSFVGPRPIVEAEIEKYGEAGFDLYKRVLPGLTGFWQISGRSNTTYEKRVMLDCYYIRNWSVWQDIYIIACTPGALLRLKEAY